MTDVLPPTADGLARAAELLRQGAVVAFPTDTVYGVGVAATRADRLEALFALKRRPLDRRIPMLVTGLDQAAGWETGERAAALADRFWPGALTLVLPSSSGGETQAFRAPDHAVALSLITATGPILATSANVSDEPDTLAADEVLIAFATQQDELAAVVDGGPVPGRRASTVLDLSVDPPRLLRDGPISPAELADVLGAEPQPA
ncbi:MAG TPA: L-threonylcarbamoyladenylate synthase [Candidatus Limnocylindria bacterium]|nr:L-threonylcarbamoyladenylate synthase [Candidatus Limnocylindria bacterium]